MNDVYQLLHERDLQGTLAEARREERQKAEVERRGGRT